MGKNSIKTTQIKLLKPHAYFRIIVRKSTEFQMKELRRQDFGPTKCMSAWEIAPVKNSLITCTSSYHRKNVYKISNESDERPRVSREDYGWTKFQSTWATTPSKTVEIRNSKTTFTISYHSLQNIKRIR